MSQMASKMVNTTDDYRLNEDRYGLEDTTAFAIFRLSANE